jgi:hypothetical protein
MKDQYGQEVPNDLVVLPFGFEPGDGPIRGDMVDPEDIDVMCRADWYEVDDGYPIILVSYLAIQGLSETDPLDCGIDLKAPGIKINRIADGLKRYSLEDGFYHA